MNILFFIHCLIGGGAERVTVNLSEELVRRGHNVTIGLTKRIIDYDVDKQVQIKVLHQPFEYNGKIVLVRKFYSLCNKVLDYWSVSKIINSSKPDVIIASWGSKISPILRLHGRIPIIASEHNTFDRAHTPAEKKQRFFTNKYFNRVVVLTQHDKEFTKDFLHNTVVIPNPLTFKPISQVEYDICFSTRKNILACGRINAYLVKGFDNLIVAFAKIADNFPDWDLDIAGAGSDENINILKNIAKKNKVEYRVHFIGFSKNMDIIMKRHAMFVLSSRTEGFGMVLTEAMAMGCPCISYALTGPTEIINNNIDGILVENQNINKLSEAMSKLMGDEALRRRLGKEAIKNVSRFAVDKITDQWESLIQEVISNG